MSNSRRTRFSIVWYNLVDKPIDGYMNYLMEESGLARNAIVRRAVTENRVMPNLMNFAEWKKKNKQQEEE